MSATPDSTLANPEQRIADLERQLAEREAALAEALEQQTATAEVLQVINASPGHLAPVFDALLDKALRLCDASYGTLLPWDGERLHRSIFRGASVELLEALAGSEPVMPRPGSVADRLLHGENIICTADITEDPSFARSPRVQILGRVGGVRSYIAVALRKDDRFLGFIAIYRREVRPFTDKQIALLQNFAAQAVIAMENARLITETREALEQQTATAEVLGVINSSPGNLTPVFEAMLEKALSLCDAGYGCLRTYDGKLFHPVADRGNAQFSEIALGWEPFEPLPGSPPARIASGEAVVQIADLVANAAREPGNPRARALVEIGGARTAIWVAMRNESQLLGYITAYRQEAKPFTDKQIALLQNFAAQAVIAMENARLLTETREALEQQTATAEVLGVINSSPGDLVPVFDVILEKAHALCGAAKGALAIRVGEHFQAVATRGLSEAFATLIRRPMRNTPGSPNHRMLSGERFLHIADHRTQPGEIPRAAAELEGARTVLFIPLRKDSQLLGYITQYREEVRPFTDKQIALLENFAAQAVIAMENARLLGELRERSSDLQEALEYQTATTDVLKVISRSGAEIDPVLQTLAETAASVCKADKAVIRQLRDGLFCMAASFGFTQEYEDYISRYPIAPSRDTPTGRMALEGRIVHIEDALSDPEFTWSEAQRLGEFRTMLAVPLFREEAVIGSIFLARSRVEPFSEKQIELVRTFADQAVIAIENARLITETREALEQQTATAEVLGVINNSPGDLAPVFDALLEKALRLCEAVFGVLVNYDGERFHVTALSGVPPALAEVLQQPFSLPPGSNSARLMAGEAAVQTEDLAATEFYRSGNEIYRAFVELGKARTGLVVALRKDNDFLGALWFYRQEVRPFTDKQIALLENFAAQAVIAMENARLITETREALEQQTATAEVLGVINASPGDLAPVFDAMLERATRLCEATYGHLYTYDGKRYHPVAVHGEAQFVEWRLQRGPIEIPVARNAQPVATSGAPLERLVAGERVVVIDDAPSTETYRASAGFRALVDASGIRSGVTVALRKDAALLGAITVYRQEVRPFSEREVALLENFAAQAVIAIENARLITETREALEQQTATAEVLQVINSSPGDLAPVFDAILDKAHILCGAALGDLMIFDGEQFRHGAVRAEPRFVEYWRQNPVRPPREGGGGLSRLLRGERVVHIPDVREGDAYRDIPDYRLRMDLGGIRTLLSVPLRKDDVLLGVITAYRQEVLPFSDKQIALLQNFAAQAVIAMENARLLTETREALEQQTATSEVLGVINSSPGDLAPVFDAILEKAHALCGADSGGLVLVEGNRYRAVAVHGEPSLAEYWLDLGWIPFPTGEDTVFGRLSRGEVVHLRDAAIDDGTRKSDQYHRLVELAGARSLVLVPLRKDDVLFGTITGFRNRVQPFSDKQIALLENFAAQAVIAMENARLITETREALEQQTATAEVLQVINSSPGDLAPVFNAILEKALNLCEAACGHLYRYDGEFLHPMAMRGEARYIEFLRQRGAVRLTEGSPTPIMRVISSGEYVQVPDCREDEGYRLSERFRAQADAGGWRSALCVPLRKDAAVVGTITVFRQEVQPFTDKQIALLQNFAAQAVIAIENARLLGELRQRTEEVGELNRDLEARVAEQVDELGRVGRLKRFLAPQLAELIVSQGDEKILESHRREIVVVFCDLRGYTAFTETAEPEEVLDFLRQYHGALGPLVSQFEGTLDQFSGDGIMVFFNDPIPCPDPAERAVKMAIAMREVAGTLIAAWRRRGRMLGFGAGIAQGYATLGQIGFADRSGYTAIGTVCNLAARLCAEAKDGQILIAQLVAVAVEETTPLEEVGELTLKGLTQPVVAYNVPLAATQPALRVIEGGGPQSV